MIEMHYAEKQVNYTLSVNPAINNTGKVLGYILPNYDANFYPLDGNRLPDTRAISGDNSPQLPGEGVNDRIVLTERVQNWLYRELKSLVPNWTKAQVDSNFNKLFHGRLALANFHGSESNAVYPTGANLDKPPMLGNALTFGCSFVEMWVDANNNLVVNPKRSDEVIFKCVDPFDENLESITYQNSPFLFSHPVIAWATPGMMIEIPFDHFNGPIYPPMLNHSNKAYLHKKWVQIIKPGDFMPTRGIVRP